MPDFAGVGGGLLRVHVATHTGEVDLRFTVVDTLPDAGRGGGRATETVLLPIVDHHLVVEFAPAG